MFKLLVKTALVTSLLATGATAVFADNEGRTLPTGQHGTKAPSTTSFGRTADGFGYVVTGKTDNATGASIDHPSIGNQVIYPNNGRNYVRLSFDDGKRF